VQVEGGTRALDGASTGVLGPAVGAVREFGLNEASTIHPKLILAY